MKETWASGSAELLHHARSHMEFETAIDFRLAFISIDNATELMLSTYVSLPARVFGDRAPSRGEVSRSDGSFPRLLDLAFKLNATAFDEISLNDIDYYHRLRNLLYHQGTGISVDSSHLQEYFRLAVLLQERLFSVKQNETSEPATLKDARVLLLGDARSALDDGFNARQSIIVKAANQRIRSQGGKLGAGLKPLHKRQEKLMKTLWNKGASREAITQAVNQLGKTLSPKITISSSSVKRRVNNWIVAGVLPPRSKSKAPMS